MSDTVRCPDCGQENAAGSESCTACNFPLRPAAEPPPSSARHEAGPSGSAPAGRPIRPIRPRRPRPQPPIQLQLWLFFSVVAAAIVIFIAVRANLERPSEPIEGANEDQRKHVAEIQEALAKDSTNIDAHIGFGNVLYDTGNWSDAIVHYRAAVNRDSSRIHALVDMGVCYFNLGDTQHAERIFLLALQRDPHQPVALFNLGIVNERLGNHVEAMRFFHRALQSNPTDEMKRAVTEAMARIGKASGMQPPPLPQPPGMQPGAPPDTQPGR